MAMAIQLNASEIANLWSCYIGNSASVCLLQHYLQNVEDVEIKLLLNQSYNNSLKSVLGASYLFQEAKHILPHGFTENDVNKHAPRLFSDLFYLLDIWRLSEYGMVFLGLSLSTSIHPQVRSFFSDLIQANTKLMNDAVDLAMKRSITLNPPLVPAPDKVEYIEKEHFFGGLFGDRRSLSVVEIKELVFNLIGMSHGEALFMGFSQVAESRDVLDYFIRTKETCAKQANSLQSILHEDDLPSIPTLQDHITSSRIAPYSDKLMLYLNMTLAQVVFGRYGVAMTQCHRSDIMLTLTRLMAECANAAKDGLDIMIENEWMEQPPLASNRNALTKQS
jgi:hypothetical protein